MALEKNEILSMFMESSALMTGHFRLSSGRHSDRYLQCARLLQYPDRARITGIALAEKFRDHGASAVIAPAIGGIIVAHELAASLGIRAIFGERQDGAMKLRRGFEITPGEKLILVEDVVTTGKSTGEILNLIAEYGGTPVGIGALADRSSGRVRFPFPVRALIQLDFANWDPETCPLCQAGIPLHTPGSRFTK